MNTLNPLQREELRELLTVAVTHQRRLWDTLRDIEELTNVEVEEMDISDMSAATEQHLPDLTDLARFLESIKDHPVASDDEKETHETL